MLPFRPPLKSSFFLQNLCTWVEIAVETLTSSESEGKACRRRGVNIDETSCCGTEGCVDDGKGVDKFQTTEVRSRLGQVRVVVAVATSGVKWACLVKARVARAGRFRLAMKGTTPEHAAKRCRQ
jgi:hypothetical protein